MHQLNAWLRKQNELSLRLEEILDGARAQGRTLTTDESDEYDMLDNELKTVKTHVRRLRAAEDADRATADPVSGGRGPTIISRRFPGEDQFQGQSFTRYAISKILSFNSGNELTPAQIAEKRWGKTHKQLVAVIKAGIAGGATETGEWGSELVQADGRFTGDFIEYLSQMTVYDKLGLREIPANVKVKGQDGIGTGYWVGEGMAIPVSAQDFSAVTLTPLKVAAISVLTNELVEDGSPSSEMLIRDGLATALAQRTDATFISAAAAVTDVSPAGILNGLSSLGSNGTTAAALRADIAELYAPFLAAYNVSDLAFVTAPLLAKKISLLTNALGQSEFPGLNATGGTLEGDRVVTGDNVGATNLILLSPKDIFRIGDSGLQISVSRDATIEQDSSPTGDSVSPTAASATMMSMFQTESTAVKVVRRINFAKRRDSAVAFIGDAQYGTAGATTA